MSKLNGVDRDKIFETIEAIKGDASVANFKFRLSNEWVSGGENKSRIEDYLGANQEMKHVKPFVLTSDEPEVLLSGDVAPNPVEYALHALAGCLTTSLAYHAAAQGVTVRKLSTRLEGHLDLRGFLGMSPDIRRGFDEIDVVFDIDADCDDARKRELIETARAHSPVFDMMSNGVPVSSRLASKPSS